MKGSRRAFQVVALAAAGALVAGSAVALAAPSKHKPRPIKHLVRVAVHADVSTIRADGTTNSYSLDRGQVTAASSTSITLKRLDGQSVTLAITSSTIVRGQIRVGWPALAYSRSGTAFRIRAPFAPLSVPALPGAASDLAPATHGGVVHADVSLIRSDGSTDSVTLDRGQVTAVSPTSVTLHRKDGHDVTIGLTSQTVVYGKLAVGGNAIVLSRGGTAYEVLARGPRS